MQNAFAVRRIERFAERRADANSLCDVDRSACQPALQRFAFQQFHDKELNRFSGNTCFADIKNRTDIRMAERRDSFGFALKSFERLRRASKLWRQDLHRNETVQPGV